MSFAPLVPYSGLAGWSFLKRTAPAQQAAFFGSAEVKRDTDYFRAHAASLRTAEDLVGDRRMLKVALGAFGLSDDIDNKYFLTKVLEGGTASADALANKLSDKRYAQFAKAFGFGDPDAPGALAPDFTERIVALFQTGAFEEAVGEQSNEMRLALNAERELPSLAASALSEDGKWYQIMSSPPLREVLQTAFGLPSSFVSLDLDRQLAVFKDASDRYLGSANPADFASSEIKDGLIRLFLVRSEASATGAANAAGATALALLRNIGSAAASLRY